VSVSGICWPRTCWLRLKANTMTNKSVGFKRTKKDACERIWTHKA
jgi:hypothetical protein